MGGVLLLALIALLAWLYLLPQSGQPDSSGVSGASGGSGLSIFMSAISAFEGGGRSDRNNNPGNLAPGVGRVIFPGQTGTDSGGFAVFDSMDSGWAALQQTVQRYLRQSPDMTFNQFFNKYSPDGNGDNYANYVAGQMGADPNSPVGLAIGG